MSIRNVTSPTRPNCLEFDYKAIDGLRYLNNLTANQFRIQKFKQNNGYWTTRTTTFHYALRAALLDKPTYVERKNPRNIKLSIKLHMSSTVVRYGNAAQCQQCGSHDSPEDSGDLKTKKTNHNSGGSRNLGTGSAVPARYNFWSLKIVLMPLHKYPIFCSESS